MSVFFSQKKCQPVEPYPWGAPPRTTVSEGWRWMAGCCPWELAWTQTTTSVLKQKSLLRWELGAGAEEAERGPWAAASRAAKTTAAEPVCREESPLTQVWQGNWGKTSCQEQGSATVGNSSFKSFSIISFMQVLFEYFSFIIFITSGCWTQMRTHEWSDINERALENTRPTGQVSTDLHVFRNYCLSSSSKAPSEPLMQLGAGLCQCR